MKKKLKQLLLILISIIMVSCQFKAPIKYEVSFDGINKQTQYVKEGEYIIIPEIIKPGYKCTITDGTYTYHPLDQLRVNTNIKLTWIWNKLEFSDFITIYDNLNWDAKINFTELTESDLSEFNADTSWSVGIGHSRFSGDYIAFKNKDFPNHEIRQYPYGGWVCVGKSLSGNEIKITLHDSISPFFDIEEAYTASCFTYYENAPNEIIITGCDIRKIGTKLIIPETILGQKVVEINSYAFSNNQNLTEISLPSTIKRIGYKAFPDCSSLKTLTIPADLDSTITATFPNCNKLSHITVTPGNSTQANYSLSTLPEIESIIFDEGITDIAKNSCYNCKTLTTVSLPSTLNSIGDSSFEGCLNLKELDLPSNLSAIGNYAFKNCTNLNMLIIPDSVTNIGDGAFDGCLFLFDMKLPEGVTTTIGREAFSNIKHLTTIKIPDFITRIGIAAFSGCSNLVSVDIPNSVKYIDKTAFNATNIKQLVIPGSVEAINTYTLPWSLEKITLSEGLQTIAQEAFSNTNVSVVDVPSTVKNIGYGAFSKTASNRPPITVNIKEGTDMSGWHEYCHGLFSFPKSSEYPWDLDYTSQFNFDHSLKGPMIAIYDKNASASGDIEINIKGNLLYGIPVGIRSNAFFKNEKINSVTIKGIKFLGSGAFRNCTNLVSVLLEDDNIDTISDGAFNGCSQLKMVQLNNAIKTIESESFSNCTNLKSITLPTTVETICRNAFQNTGLEEVVLNSTFLKIEKSAFASCKFSTLNLPEGTYYLDNNCFENCKNLTYISLPASIVLVGENVFNGCENLQEIHVHNKNEIDCTPENNWALNWLGDCKAKVIYHDSENK